MDLRPELLPPPVSRPRLEAICHEITQISELVLCGSDRADHEISAFNARTGHDYAALDFAEYDGSRSLAAFALEAARPARPRIAGITAEELAEVVRRILACDPETDYYLRLLEANVPHPRVGDLIFFPSEELRDASAEHIVEVALSYRPIAP